MRFPCDHRGCGNNIRKVLTHPGATLPAIAAMIIAILMELPGGKTAYAEP
jgi:hypothetical protein